MMKAYPFLYLFIFFFSCSTKAQKVSFIEFNHKDITYEGRINYKADAAELSWPGNSVKFNVEGSGVSFVLQDSDTANYYNVIVDNNCVLKIHPDTVKKEYVVGLTPGKHSIELFKRTEWDKGKTWFYGFHLAEGTKLLPPSPAQKRKIEFYGNSITCGYAMEDVSGKDRWWGCFENNYLTYAAITARHFDAQYSCIAKSGIGIMVSWFPLIMPEMYDRTDPTDSTSKWDFSKYTPDVVVINLFQNVKMKDYEEFKARFGTKAPDANAIIKAYGDFLKNIRNKYPQADIICALGNMDATKTGSLWPGYIQKAVDGMHDKKIMTHFFPFKNSKGHPNVAEQKMMAESLIAFIEKNIKW